MYLKHQFFLLYSCFLIVKIIKINKLKKQNAYELKNQSNYRLEDQKIKWQVNKFY